MKNWKIMNEWLIHITCNKNMIPYDTLKPNVTSGIRLGSAAMTTRGLTKEDFKEIGKIISIALKNKDNIIDEFYILYELCQ